VSRYVTRHGRRIEVVTLNTGVVPKKRRKPFKTQWVKLPTHWADTLRRSKSVNTYQLAVAILFEAFRRAHIGGEIVLSQAVTRMPRSTRRRATKELIRLGLIKVKRNGNECLRVSNVCYY
jgi:hypothetical protein